MAVELAVGVSKSKVGDVLQLPPPDTTPKGWAVIE